MSCPLLFTLQVRKGVLLLGSGHCQIQGTRHVSDEMGSSLLVTPRALERKTSHALQGCREAPLGHRANQKGLWEAGRVITEGYSSPQSPGEDVTGLFV